MREWAFTAVVFGFLLSIVVISQLSKVRNRGRLQDQVVQMEKPILITLTGAIQRPGTYQVRPGTTLKELLDEIPLSKDADRKKVVSKKVLYSTQTVQIPRKKR